MIKLNTSIEQIFSVENIDQDCDGIAGLMPSNYYSPDYLCMNAFDSFSKAINAGKFTSLEVKMLRDGLQEVASMEAVLDYGYPSVERWLKENVWL